MQDTLKRRIRFAPPQPVHDRIILRDSDLAIFEAIHRHGPLPAHYLREFGSHTNANAFADRLTQLYNGTKDGGYLIRPPEYFESFYARYQYLTYDLSERARTLLEEGGRLSPFIHRADHMIHRLMGACVGASIELGCKSKGTTYISRHEILSRKGNPISLPLSQFTEKESLEPDELFGIHADGKKAFYAVEIDRNTEQLKKKKSKNTIDAKLEGYKYVIEKRTYNAVWGTPNLRVLIVTTSEARKNAILERVDDSILNRFHFFVVPQFESPWSMPPLLDLSPVLS